MTVSGYGKVTGTVIPGWLGLYPAHPATAGPTKSSLGGSNSSTNTSPRWKLARPRKFRLTLLTQLSLVTATSIRPALVSPITAPIYLAESVSRGSSCARA
jgi:hypothetical protein